MSICITTYKSGNFIEKCINAFYDNIKYNYELIVCDNISNDSLSENIKKFKIHNLKIIYKKSNRGEGRNICANESSGDLLVFIDADNEFYALQKYIDIYMEKYYNKLLHIKSDSEGSTVYIVNRKLFFKLDGFPKINYSEDTYMKNVTESLNLYQYIKLSQEELKAIEIEGMGHGQVKRYYNNILIRALEYLNVYRCGIFVSDKNYKEFIDERTYGNKGFFLHVKFSVFYILARITIKKIKEEPLEIRIKRVERGLKEE